MSNDIYSIDKRSEIMSRIRSSNTTPEIRLRKKLYHKGYRYRISPKDLPGKPDIVLYKYNVAIFVHGCFWHQHKKCKKSVIPKSNVDFWKSKFNKNIERDNKNIEDLKRKGWRVFIAWECEINEDIDYVIYRINKFILQNESNKKL